MQKKYLKGANPNDPDEQQFSDEDPNHVPAETPE